MTAELELNWAMKVYNGLGKDIEKLMHKFVETGSIRYEGFTRIWHEMNFTLVYCGLKSLENMREFMEEAFRLSSLYLSPPFDFQQRTGGLYIIYAFYFTQRHRPRIKVRLSRQQWKDLVDMEVELKKQGHLDAYYILLKLKMHKAFCFAYSSQQFIFKHPVPEDSQDKWLAENQREIEQAFPEGLLRKLHETHHKYQHLKNQLGEERNLKHVKHSMAEVIANRFQEIEENLDANTTTEPHPTNRVSKIKEKSFLHGVESDEQITSPSSNSTSSGSDNASSPNRKRRGRRTRKVSSPPPDTRPIVERLMPVLKEYRLSDSEEEEEKKTAADTTVVEEQPKKQPITSRTKSPAKASNRSPTKRKRRTAKMPVKGSLKKPRKAAKTGPVSPGPVVPKKQKQKNPSPKKKKGTNLAREGGQGTPKKQQGKEVKSPRSAKRKPTPKGAKRSRPSRRAEPGSSRMAKISPLTE